jgi:hypothetical protein
MAYCEDADVVPYEPAGGLPNPFREVTASASGDYFVSEGHGLATDAAVIFTTPTGGALPTGIAEGTAYYAIVVSSSRFKVAATAGGAAINITTAGEHFQFRGELPRAAWREWGARLIDSVLPAHVVPIVAPYPEIVVSANAELAAAKGVSVTGGAEINLGEKQREVVDMLIRWAKTIPLRGTARSVTSPVNLAITASAGASDPRGWSGDDATRIP